VATSSTNSYTTELLSQSDIPDWTVVTTDYQPEGRGQRGRSWISEPAKNLLCSIVLRPQLKVREQYLLAMAVSLGISDLLTEYGLEPMIKWPNDVLVQQQKIAGILIENQLKGDGLDVSVVGIGLNLNQLQFESFDWPATSLALEIGKTLQIEKVLEGLVSCIKVRVHQMQSDRQTLCADHATKLFGHHEHIEFSFQGAQLHGRIISVEADGGLRLDVEGEKRIFYNGEIKLLRSV